MVKLSDYLFQELLQCHLSLCNQDDVLDNALMTLKVNVPHLTQGQLWQHPVDIETTHQLLPVAFFEGFRLQLHHKHIHLGVSSGLKPWIFFRHSEDLLFVKFFTHEVHCSYCYLIHISFSNCRMSHQLRSLLYYHRKVNLLVVLSAQSATEGYIGAKKGKPQNLKIILNLTDKHTEYKHKSTRRHVKQIHTEMD